MIRSSSFNKSVQENGFSLSKKKKMDCENIRNSRSRGEYIYINKYIVIEKHMRETFYNV